MEQADCGSENRRGGCWVRVFALLLLAGALASGNSQAQPARYRYMRIGSPKDASSRTKFGAALMGGGSDLDEAFRWLCEKGGGGDFLVLRAVGDDEYNSYVQGLCPANSVATLIIGDREAADDARVAGLIQQAEVIFLAGGDQARYMNWWQQTRVQAALNAHIAAGKPIGGTSAGLAVLGEYVYSAQGDAPDEAGLTSEQALANPYFKRVTVRRDFLKIPDLENTLTDSHFAKRDRMGRTVTFLARIVQDGWSAHPREIAIDEGSAVLIEDDGTSRVVGSGQGAYFLSVRKRPQVCAENRPLTFRDIRVYHGATGARFNVRKWKAKAGANYALSVEKGQVRSTQPGHEIY